MALILFSGVIFVSFLLINKKDNMYNKHNDKDKNEKTNSSN